jgi:hypothetical protein
MSIASSFFLLALKIFGVDAINQFLFFERAHLSFGLFGEEGLESIFDWMLIPFIAQFFGNSGPFLAVELNILNQDKVLLILPILLEFGRIEMIEPPFPALLGSPKVLSFGLDE